MINIKDKGLQRVYVRELRRLLAQRNNYFNENDVFDLINAKPSLKKKALECVKNFSKVKTSA